MGRAVGEMGIGGKRGGERVNRPEEMMMEGREDTMDQRRSDMDNGRGEGNYT